MTRSAVLLSAVDMLILILNFEKTLFKTIVIDVYLAENKGIEEFLRS